MTETELREKVVAQAAAGDAVSAATLRLFAERDRLRALAAAAPRDPHAEALVAAADLKALAAEWNTLPRQAQLRLAGVKDARKAELALVPPDPDARARRDLEQAVTLNALAAAWGELSAEQQLRLRAVKDRRKDELSKAAAAPKAQTGVTLTW